MTGRRLRPEEERLWARIAASVAPSPARRSKDGGAKIPAALSPNRSGPVVSVTLSAQPPKPAARPERVDGHKRVRRGAIDIDGRIDLHGFTRDAARTALLRALSRVHADGGRCLLVITGKGRTIDHFTDDPGPHGVLRRALPEWLAEPAFAEKASGYAPANPRHGGVGAWYVFLRRRT